LSFQQGREIRASKLAAPTPAALAKVSAKRRRKRLPTVSRRAVPTVAMTSVDLTGDDQDAAASSQEHGYITYDDITTYCRII